MITIGNFAITFYYHMSPMIAISTDKKLLSHKKYNGNGIDTIIIPNYTTTTKIFLIGKTDNDTIVKNGRIVDSQRVEITGVCHQGINFDQKKFFHYYHPMMFHQNSSELSTKVVFNFPTYLTFENIAPAIHLINQTVETVG